MKRFLIFSKKCQSCANLIVILRNMNLLLNFEMVCLEDLISQGKQPPPNIKTVPALIMQDINVVLQGKETFEWVEKIRMNMIKANIAKNAQQIGPHGFTNVEMGGFSDNFAYTLTDLAQPKSFLPYGKDDEYVIYTGKEVNKLNNKDMDKIINDASKKRKEQDKAIGEIMDNSKKEIILNYEKQKILTNLNN
jgi:hypothetical protein